MKHYLTSTILLFACLVFPPVNAEDISGGGQPKASYTELVFDIWEYQVLGNTLLDNNRIERAVYQFLGPNKTIKDVERARIYLEGVYHDQGYGTVVVDIPEQDVRQGVVKLSVTEGSIDRLRISGSHYYSLGYIRSRVPALTRGEVPYLPDVQEQLEALNQESPDRQVTPVLKPGRSPGTVEIELKVKDELPLHGSIEVTDRYSPDTSTLRLVTNLRYDNLWQRGHSIGLSYQVAPENPDEVTVVSGTYILRWPGRSKNVLALYALNSDSEVAAAGTVAVIGKGTVVGARYILSLNPVRNYYHNVKLGVDYKNFSEDTFLIGGDTNKRPITYLNWSSEYELSYIQYASTTRFTIGPNFGVRGLLNDESDFSRKRLGSQANYLYISSSLDYMYRWPKQYVFSAKLNGQLTTMPLISNEQFSAGGVDSVRGYQESEVLGDDGLRASLELRTPSYASVVPVDEVNDFHFIGFIDAARIWFSNAPPGQKKSTDLIGTGIGVRLSAGKTLSAGIDIAWPLNDAGKTEADDIRSHFSVRLGF